MESTSDLSLQETRLWLTDYAHRRFTPIPGDAIAQHVISVTEGADFPVRRAAIEALHRRMQNVGSDGLFVKQSPERTALGQYTIARPSDGNGSVRKRHEPRPYETVLLGVAPLGGQCDCPDYLKGGLGLCKHLLTAIAHVFEKPKRLNAALRESARLDHAPHYDVAWNPVIPLAGSGDRLLGLRLTEGSSAKGFKSNGAVNLSQLGDTKLRATFLRNLVGQVNKQGRRNAALSAGPGVKGLLVAELEVAERLCTAESEARVALGHLKGLKRHLYPYQLEGVKSFLEQGRLLLADDMGLGKTTQAIACCHALFHCGMVKRGLVIVPAALKPQWLREWQATTDVPVIMVDGNTEERRKAYDSAKRGFVIVNYELLLREFDRVASFAHEFVILDEAQRIKNYATKSAVYVKALPSQRRLVLTGTPMENRLDDLASILDWVDDRALAPKWRLPAWHIRYEGDGMKARVGARNLETLRQRIDHCVVRRVRQEVLDQLPGRTDTRVSVPMTREQDSEHASLNQPIAQLAAIAQRRPLKQAEFLRLMSLMNTQRIIANGLAQLQFEELWPSLAGHPPTAALLEGLFAPKLLELRNLVEALVIDQGRKVVIFSQWRRMLKLADWAVSDLLSGPGKRSLFFTGAESSKLRAQSLVEFHDDPHASLLFLTDAGGVGLNLQCAANACINLEQPWNPAVLEQRIGRIYRLGQKHPIDVYNLVCEDSIEGRIAGIVGAKRILFKGVFDGTTNEVRFEGEASFAAEVRRLLDLTVPEAPAIASALPLDSDAPSEDATSEPPDVADTDTVVEVAAALTTGESTTVEAATVELLADDEFGTKVARQVAAKESSSSTQQGFPAPHDVQRLFEQLRISQTEDGCLRVEAPKEAARTLAAVLESLGRMLRDVADDRRTQQ
jgi:superfamily II DNA or RNA helicase